MRSSKNHDLRRMLSSDLSRDISLDLSFDRSDELSLSDDVSRELSCDPSRDINRDLSQLSRSLSRYSYGSLSQPDSASLSNCSSCSSCSLDRFLSGSTTHTLYHSKNRSLCPSMLSVMSNKELTESSSIYVAYSSSSFSDAETEKTLFSNSSNCSLSNASVSDYTLSKSCSKKTQSKFIATKPSSDTAITNKKKETHYDRKITESKLCQMSDLEVKPSHKNIVSTNTTQDEPCSCDEVDYSKKIASHADIILSTTDFLTGNNAPAIKDDYDYNKMLSTKNSYDKEKPIKNFNNDSEKYTKNITSYYKKSPIKNAFYDDEYSSDDFHVNRLLSDKDITSIYKTLSSKNTSETNRTPVDSNHSVHSRACLSHFLLNMDTAFEDKEAISFKPQYKSGKESRCYLCQNNGPNIKCPKIPDLKRSIELLNYFGCKLNPIRSGVIKPGLIKTNKLLLGLNKVEHQKNVSSHKESTLSQLGVNFSTQYSLQYHNPSILYCTIDSDTYYNEEKLSSLPIFTKKSSKKIKQIRIRDSGVAAAIIDAGGTNTQEIVEVTEDKLIQSKTEKTKDVAGDGIYKEQVFNENTDKLLLFKEKLKKYGATTENTEDTETKVKSTTVKNKKTVSKNQKENKKFGKLYEIMKGNNNLFPQTPEKIVYKNSLNLNCKQKARKYECRCSKNKNDTKECELQTVATQPPFELHIHISGQHNSCKHCGTERDINLKHLAVINKDMNNNNYSHNTGYFPLHTAIKSCGSQSVYYRSKLLSNRNNRSDYNTQQLSTSLLNLSSSSTYNFLTNKYSKPDNYKIEPKLITLSHSWPDELQSKYISLTDTVSKSNHSESQQRTVPTSMTSDCDYSGVTPIRSFYKWTDSYKPLTEHASLLDETNRLNNYSPQTKSSTLLRQCNKSGSFKQQPGTVPLFKYKRNDNYEPQEKTTPLLHVYSWWDDSKFQRDLVPSVKSNKFDSRRREPSILSLSDFYSRPDNYNRLSEQPSVRVISSKSHNFRMQKDRVNSRVKRDKSYSKKTKERPISSLTLNNKTNTERQSTRTLKSLPLPTLKDKVGYYRLLLNYVSWTCMDYYQPKASPILSPRKENNCDKGPQPNPSNVPKKDNKHDSAVPELYPLPILKITSKYDNFEQQTSLDNYDVNLSQKSLLLNLSKFDSECDNCKSPLNEDKSDFCDLGHYLVRLLKLGDIPNYIASQIKAFTLYREHKEQDVCLSELQDVSELKLRQDNVSPLNIDIDKC